MNFFANAKAYLGLYQTFMMELFGENNWRFYNPLNATVALI